MQFERIPLPPLDPEREPARLRLLAELDILDTAPEREFDMVVEAAQRLMGCRIALVSLVDANRQWFKAVRGLDVCETGRDVAFCAHAIAGDGMLIVEDAKADPRFAANPLVTGPPHIRFYAGVPLHIGQVSPASAVGTLCVIDDRPRTLSPAQENLLRDLAHIAEAFFTARHQSNALARLADEQQVTLRRIDRAHRLLRQAERMANVGSWRLAIADNKLEWSDQTYTIHGMLPGSEPPLETALNFYPQYERPRILAAIEHTIATGEPYDIETDFLTAQGELRRVRSMAELESRDGRPEALIGVFQDITDRHAAEQALRRSAETDPLTGLANRGALNAYLDARVLAAREEDAPLAVLLIDLDHFKSVNDLCGHAAGDDLLRLMADRLRDAAADAGYVARLGGDEFVIVVDRPTLLADLPALIEGMLATLRHRVEKVGSHIAVSATIGACRLAPGVRDRSDLLMRADAALYRAKHIQRGTAIIDGDDEPLRCAA